MQNKWGAAFVFLALAMGSAAPAADLGSEALPPEGAEGFSPPQNAGGANGEIKIALGLRLSGLLGVGLEGAVEVTRKSNIGLGFNFFNYSFYRDERRHRLRQRVTPSIGRPTLRLVSLGRRIST